MSRYKKYQRRYEPAAGDSLETLLSMARHCGEDLNPSDRRARWIDSHPESQALIDAYHAGQSWAYEDEDW